MERGRKRPVDLGHLCPYTGQDQKRRHRRRRQRPLPPIQGRRSVDAEYRRQRLQVLHSWPRIFPQGTGTPNPKGLDFYNRLVDELKSAGIESFPTLYHWDLPQALQDKGGWQSRDTATAFADYAGYMAEKLSDRVHHFFTLNETRNFTDTGYRGLEVKVGGGVVRLENAPGLKVTPAELNQVRHHAVLAHGLAVQAIHARGKKGTQCGPADVLSGAVPLIETEEHIRAAHNATRELNAPFLTVILEGKY